MESAQRHNIRNDTPEIFARTILSRLEEAGFKARLAGGCVRDRLLGKTPKDFDVATDATPEEVTRVFRKLKCKVLPTGVEHGTLTIMSANRQVEVTTLRRDVETDGRHARIQFSTSFKEDAARRDFTINAMYEDQHGKIFDYFDGKDDLREGRLRFVGDPVERIREDRLRILRFFRFWARLDFVPDEQALSAIESEREGLSWVSRERINSELFFMFECEAIKKPVVCMSRLKIFDVIFPWWSPGKVTAASPIFGDLHGMREKDKAFGRFVCLLFPWFDSYSFDASIGREMKLGNKDIKRLGFALEGMQKLVKFERFDVAAALDFVDLAENLGGQGSFSDFFVPIWQNLLEHDAVNDADYRGIKERICWIQAQEAAFGDRRTARVPIEGKALMKGLKIKQSPILGHLLRELKRTFRNGEWKTEKEGMVLARSLLKEKDQLHHEN